MPLIGINSLESDLGYKHNPDLLEGRMAHHCEGNLAPAVTRGTDAHFGAHAWQEHGHSTCSNGPAIESEGAAAGSPSSPTEGPKFSFSPGKRHQLRHLDFAYPCC